MGIRLTFQILSGFTRGLVMAARSGALTRTFEGQNAFALGLERMDGLVRSHAWRDCSMVEFMGTPRHQALYATLGAAILATEPSLQPGQAFDIALIRLAAMPECVRRQAEEHYRSTGRQGIEPVLEGFIPRA